MNYQRRDPREIRRRNRKVFAVLAVVCIPAFCCAAYWWYQENFVAGIVPGPTFVEDLRSGTVTPKMVTKVEILKFCRGMGGVPRTEEGYAKKARVSLKSTESVRELLTILKEDSTEGHTWRNHPTSLTAGYLRFEMADGNFCYVRYYIYYYEGVYFTTLDVNSVGSTNIIGAEVYENIPLGAFLREHDPWSYPIESPVWESGRRVNYPDTEP